MSDLREAAQMALDALDIYREHNEENIGLADAAYEALRQALAQPEQEPECIGVIGNWGRVEWNNGVFPQLGDRLYSAPQKREWVGLTRRELDIATLGLEDLGDCYVAIEAKLKEKNG